MGIFCNTNEDGTRLCLWFPYDPGLVTAAKAIPGARFTGRDRGGPYWSWPATLDNARQLRETFPAMELGGGAMAWGRNELRERKALHALAGAETALLGRLPEELPELVEFMSARPYQLADVAFMARTMHPLNANEPGLGKTVETIASIFEAGNANGPNLIVAPKTSLEVVWQFELERWQPHPVILAHGSAKQRNEALDECLRMKQAGLPFWCVTTIESVRTDEERDDVGRLKKWSFKHPLFKIDWNSIVIDEFHKTGMSNTKTITYRSVNRLSVGQRIAISGTPMGGKAIKLWSVLHWLHPDKFPSKYAWAERWLGLTPNKFGGVEIGDAVKPELEQKFYEEHAAYMVRRRKAEVRPELPAKHRIDVWCNMTKAQRAQYEAIEKDAVLLLGDERVPVFGQLAEFTRCKQVAVSCIDGAFQPTGEGGKLEQLERILDERLEDGSEERIVVFSQFKRILDYLADKYDGACEKITGDVSAERRASIIRWFEGGRGSRLLFMTIGAGGVAITLNASTAMVFLDETWVPDDMEQAEDRNRNNSATLYYLRCRNTIDEYVQGVVGEKRESNRLVLDALRERFRQ